MLRLFAEIGELGGVSFREGTGNNLGEVVEDEASENASRKVRAPLVGVSFSFGFKVAFFRGVTECDGREGSTGLDSRSCSVFTGTLVLLSCASFNGAGVVFDTASSTGISITCSSFRLFE